MGKKNKNRVDLQQSIPMEDEEYEAKEVEEEDQNKEKTTTKKKKKKKKKNKREIRFKIETVNGQPDKAAPLIGYFSSGFDPLKTRTHEEEEEGQDQQTRVRVLKNVKRSNRLQLVVSPNESKVEFVGTNYSGEAAAPQVCTYALGVLDKQSQTLKIVQIEANKIFRLEPRTENLDVPDTDPAEGLKEELTVEQKAEKLLVYQNRKNKRAAIKRHSLHQKPDAQSMELLDKKTGAIKVNKEALEVSGTATNDRNIPPHDMEATIPQMAYPLEKIIFKGEWDYLLDIAELSRAGKELEPNAYPIFVCNRVHKLEVVKDEVVKETLACIFSYINHLIKYKDKHSMDGVSSAKSHKLPSILTQKFNAMFPVTESRRLPDDKKDLLIGYVLVLTLFADDFKTDPTDIAKDLRINPISLRPYLEHLGCKFVREGTIYLAKLSAPLEFPTIRKRRRR